MKKLDYEAGMEELEGIVQCLERGSLKLQESFAAYEKGAKLVQQLEKLLSEGEAKIAALQKKAEGFTEEDISQEV